MSRARRPSPARVADWLEGRLDPEQASAMADAVRDDPELAELATWLRELSAIAATVPLESPPPLLRQRLRQYFNRWSNARAVLRPPIPSIRVDLVFDSRFDTPLAQVRGGEGLDQQFHFAFRADPADLVVDVCTRQDGLLDLSGQVLAIGTSTASIFDASVAGAGPVRRGVDGDELGRFEVQAVSPERVELRLGNGEVELVAELDLRPPRA